jgi:hypothetical protein
MTPPLHDGGGASPTMIDVIRSTSRIEGKLESFTDLVKSLQADHNNFDSRLATLELANAARTQLIERIINVENSVKAMMPLYWKAIGAGGAILLLMQFLAPLILAKFK